MQTDSCNLSTESGCPLPEPHQRLLDAHRLWHQCESNYTSPDGFRVNLNATIEALRNTTFVLQKNKAKIPNFDAWYIKWQDHLRKDQVMRWLVNARNRVVKQGDLDTLSTARVKLLIK